ncbi:MAG: hypothetical protein U1E31_01830 [Rickettsiales bacterium]
MRKENKRNKGNLDNSKSDIQSEDNISLIDNDMDESNLNQSNDSLAELHKELATVSLDINKPLKEQNNESKDDFFKIFKKIYSYIKSQQQKETNQILTEISKEEINQAYNKILDSNESIFQLLIKDNKLSKENLDNICLRAETALSTSSESVKNKINNLLNNIDEYDKKKSENFNFLDNLLKNTKININKIEILEEKENLNRKILENINTTISSFNDLLFSNNSILSQEEINKISEAIKKYEELELKYYGIRDSIIEEQKLWNQDIAKSESWERNSNKSIESITENTESITENKENKEKLKLYNNANNTNIDIANDLLKKINTLESRNEIKSFFNEALLQSQLKNTTNKAWQTKLEKNSLLSNASLSQNQENSNKWKEKMRNNKNQSRTIKNSL